MEVMKTARGLLLAVCLFTILPSVSGLSVSDCPAINAAQNVYFRSATDTCYYLWPGQKTYSDAKNTCKEKQLHLVQLEDLAEQSWLHERIPNPHWLGIKQKSNGDWYWCVNRATVLKTDPRWVAGGTNGNRAFKQSSTQWASTPKSSSYSFVCEVRLEPPCSGFKKMHFRKVDTGNLTSLLTIENVHTMPECQIECAMHASCRGIQVVLHAGKCTLLMSFDTTNTCPSGSECYQLFFDGDPQGD